MSTGRFNLVSLIVKKASLSLCRNTGIADKDGNAFVNSSDALLLGKLGFETEDYASLEKTSEVLDLYSFVEKVAGVPKAVARAVDKGEAFSGSYLKDMEYNVPKGYEVKGDLVCPVEKTAMLEKESFEKTANALVVSGIHGDEPAGNIAAKKLDDKVDTVTDVNPTEKRRFEGKDINRHFDKPSEGSVQKKLLDLIEAKKPSSVISLHEDDEIAKPYAYSSKTMADKVKEALKGKRVASSAHGDVTDNGVISGGKNPPDGSLEKALDKRDIPHATIETPSKSEGMEDRVKTHLDVLKGLLDKESGEKTAALGAGGRIKLIPKQERNSLIRAYRKLLERQDPANKKAVRAVFGANKGDVLPRVVNIDGKPSILHYRGVDVPERLKRPKWSGGEKPGAFSEHVASPNGSGRAISTTVNKDKAKNIQVSNWSGIGEDRFIGTYATPLEELIANQRAHQKGNSMQAIVNNAWPKEREITQIAGSNLLKAVPYAENSVSGKMIPYREGAYPTQGQHKYAQILEKLAQSSEKPGLWANIHAKKARGEKAAKPGDEAYPDKEQWKKLSKKAAPRWEKELLSMSPDKAREAISRMASKIPVIGGVSPRLISRPSKSLLSHQLADGENMHIPSTVLRLKETMRDMLHADYEYVPKEGLSALTNIQKRSRLKALDLKRPDRYAPTQDKTYGIDPEAEVPFIHGGGERFLNGFLSGKEQGYKLENDPRKGIQVHGHNPEGPNPLEHKAYLDRTDYYANRGAIGNFDSPAKLTGRVKAKNLLNAVNGYEHAIVDPSHIIDPVVSKLHIDKGSLPHLGTDQTKLLNTLTPIRKEAAGRCWEGYKPVPGKEPYSNDSCEPENNEKPTLEKEAGRSSGILTGFLKKEIPLFHGMGSNARKGLLKKQPRLYSASEAIARGLASNVEGNHGLTRRSANLRIDPNISKDSASYSIKDLYNNFITTTYPGEKIESYAVPLSSSVANLKYPGNVQNYAASSLGVSVNPGGGKNWNSIFFEPNMPRSEYGSVGIMTTPSRVTNSSSLHKLHDGSVAASSKFIPGEGKADMGSLALPSASGKIYYIPTKENAPLAKELIEMHGRHSVIPYNKKTKNFLKTQAKQTEPIPVDEIHKGNVGWYDMVAMDPGYEQHYRDTKANLLKTIRENARQQKQAATDHPIVSSNIKADLGKQAGMMGSLLGGFTGSYFPKLVNNLYERFSPSVMRNIQPLKDQHLREMVNSMGLRNRVGIEKPKLLNVAKGNSNNAWFNPDDNSIGATSMRYWRPNMVAHELGHAQIHNSQGPVSWIQRNLYKPTERISRHIAPYLGAAAGYATPHNPMAGMLLGGTAGALTDMGRLIPEFEASRRGIGAIMRSSMPFKEKLKNSLMTVPQFLTYASQSIGSGAAAGGLSSMM